MARLRSWWRKRRLARVMIAADVWQRVEREWLQRYGLDEAERARLRELASLFLDRKVVSGVRMVPTDHHRAVIAANACVLILELNLDWYAGWTEIILYPDTFLVRHEEMDRTGVVHEHVDELGGESWDRGPLVLSWADIASEQGRDGIGYNVILHEFAHKLDMLNGSADGLPPLHKGMILAEWTRVFQGSFKRLIAEAERGQASLLDPYGAESPAEFFAIASEAFFETPQAVMAFEPALYDQLAQFYRQNPLARMRQP